MTWPTSTGLAVGYPRVANPPARPNPAGPRKATATRDPDYYERRKDTRKQAAGHVKRLERPGFQVTSPHPRRQPSDRPAA
jgi:hypothetical protein